MRRSDTAPRRGRRQGQRPSQRNALLQRRHREGIGTAVIGQMDRRFHGTVSIPVGLDHHNHAATLPAGRVLHNGVVVPEGRQADGMRGAL